LIAFSESVIDVFMVLFSFFIKRKRSCIDVTSSSIFGFLAVECDCGVSKTSSSSLSYTVSSLFRLLVDFVLEMMGELISILSSVLAHDLRAMISPC